ncbi:MAG: hypothetical protein M3137_15420 [Actinomycetota bacterium]|nr:hypothetical protein [Actinomycetota bacterium]
MTQMIAGQSYPLLMQDFFGGPLLVAHDGVIEAVAGSQTPNGQKPPA